jgi:hypothetical protein
MPLMSTKAFQSNSRNNYAKKCFSNVTSAQRSLSRTNSTNCSSINSHNGSGVKKSLFSEKEMINGLNQSIYGAEIKSHLKSLENSFAPKEGFLQRHNMKEIHRARMVDWMLEVLFTFECRELTFFISVSLMDRYFMKIPKPLKTDELHLIGLTCMLIATKVEEIYPFSMRRLV